MATFIIIPSVGSNTFDTIFPEKFANKAMRLPNGEWLVAYDGTSKQLSEEAGITETEPSTGSAMVLNFSAYWGRASQDIWEWIKENGES